MISEEFKCFFIVKCVMDTKRYRNEDNVKIDAEIIASQYESIIVIIIFLKKD